MRYARDFRDHPEALARVLVAPPTGAQVPLVQLADLRFRTGAPMLRGEDGTVGWWAMCLWTWTKGAVKAAFSEKNAE